LVLNRKNTFTLFIFSVLFLLILIHLINQNVGDLPRVLQLTLYAFIPVAGGLTTFCIFSLLETLSSSPRLVVFHIMSRISEDAARSFFIGFFGTAYLILIRPNLAAHVPFLPHMEWISIGLAVYLMYAEIKLADKELYVSSDEHLGWKKHAEVIARETGRDLKLVTAAIEQFVEHGTKEPLLIYLTLHLQRLGLPEESIFQKLNSLMYYQEQKRSKMSLLFSFPWTERKLAIENRKERRDLLSILFEKIQMV
jgi:hypothetical protein